MTGTSRAWTPSTDATRFLSDLRQLARIGALDGGVHRPAYSTDDVAARAWLAERMAQAGLAVTVDGVGNVLGLSPAPRAVLLGSHTDTVPRGGWLDGALGVIAGLEIARAWREQTDTSTGAIGVDVVSFAAEECGTVGSRSFCGDLDLADLRRLADTVGRPLGELLDESGYADRPPARLDRSRYVAYLELHIEQGPHLEAERLDLGIVTGIVGMRRSLWTFVGREDHAGTTPMAQRRDAGAAGIQFAAAVRSWFARHAGPEAVMNIGRVELEPGAANVVPARAEVQIEHRDMDEAWLDDFDQAVASAADTAANDHAVKVEPRALMEEPPSPLDPALVEVAEQAAARTGRSVRRIVSRAGHDAMVLARHLPAGMLFVPSAGGRSHTVDEDTLEPQLLQGLEALAATVAILCEQGR